MKISISGAVIARAFGKLGNYVICYLYGRIQYMRRVWTEKRASPSQISWREIYRKVDSAYTQLTEEQIRAWGLYAPRHQTAYSYFMKINLKRAKEGKNILWWPPQTKGG